MIQISPFWNTWYSFKYIFWLHIVLWFVLIYIHTSSHIFSTILYVGVGCGVAGRLLLRGEWVTKGASGVVLWSEARTSLLLGGWEWSQRKEGLFLHEYCASAILHLTDLVLVVFEKDQREYASMTFPLPMSRTQVKCKLGPP